MASIKEALIVFTVATTIGVGIFLFLFFFHGIKNHSPVKPYYYRQVLDHLGLSNYSEFTFSQRVFIDHTHWEGPKSDGPVLVYLGGQTRIEDYVGSIGLINAAAPKLKALVLYIEHRFYGESVPYGSIERAMADKEVRAYLTVEQVLSDYGDIIDSLKTTESIQHAPVIVIGCSYGGMLAAWFRLQFPQTTVGAVASSAPMYYFYGGSGTPGDAFCQVVSQDYKEINGQCHDIIRSSWDLIDEAASLPNGLDTLTTKFNSCRPLQSTNELKMYIAQRYILAARENSPLNQWIRRVCDIIIDPSNNDIMDRISSAVSFVEGDGSCKDLESSMPTGRLFQLSPIAMTQWKWQLCTDLVIPSGCSINTMLPSEVFDISEYAASCQQEFGISPKPNLFVSYHGEADMISGLGSNIIFSNGLKDPNSFAGILQNISESIVAINAGEGTHCSDMHMEEDHDPQWLVNMRETQINIFTKWIEEYRPSGHKR